MNERDASVTGSLTSPNQSIPSTSGEQEVAQRSSPSNIFLQFFNIKLNNCLTSMKLFTANILETCFFSFHEVFEHCLQSGLSCWAKFDK